MGVAGEILQNTVWTAERRFSVDNPVDPFSLAAQSLKRSRLGEAGHLPMKLKLAFSKRVPEIGQKLVPEETAQYPDRKKERFPTADPACAVRADAARSEERRVGQECRSR